MTTTVNTDACMCVCPVNDNSLNVNITTSGTESGNGNGSNTPSSGIITPSVGKTREQQIIYVKIDQISERLRRFLRTHNTMHIDKIFGFDPLVFALWIGENPSPPTPPSAVSIRYNFSPSQRTNTVFLIGCCDDTCPALDLALYRVVGDPLFDGNSFFFEAEASFSEDCLIPPQ